MRLPFPAVVSKLELSLVWLALAFTATTLWDLWGGVAAVAACAVVRLLPPPHRPLPPLDRLSGQISDARAYLEELGLAEVDRVNGRALRNLLDDLKQAHPFGRDALADRLAAELATAQGGMLAQARLNAMAEDLHQRNLMALHTEIGRLQVKAARLDTLETELMLDLLKAKKQEPLPPVDHA